MSYPGVVQGEPLASGRVARFWHLAVALRRGLWLLRRTQSANERTSLPAKLALLDQLRGYLMPEYVLSDYAKLWFEDEQFFETYHRLMPSSPQTAERKFFLRELLRLVTDLDGDTAEAGVFTGASSWFICASRQGRRSAHWAFDSFQGISSPAAPDGTFWRVGDLRVGSQVARAVLKDFDARVLEGWIPAVFAEAQIERLVFAHIDVDLYEPTLASMEFFYPLVVPGGVVVCDDYGSAITPGATRAVDDYMAGRPEPVIHAPTGQGIIIRR